MRYHEKECRVNDKNGEYKGWIHDFKWLAKSINEGKLSSASGFMSPMKMVFVPALRPNS